MFASDSNRTKTGSNGSFDNINNVFCDYAANNFEIGDASRPTLTITILNGTHAGAIAEISEFINSSCVELEKNPGWDEDVSGILWDLRTGLKINFNDGDAYKFVVGNDPASLFK